MRPRERPPPRPDDDRGGDPSIAELPAKALTPEITEGCGAPQDDAETPSLISPIACAFDGDELLLGSITNMADLAASFARSAAEAAYRGDKETLAVHLREARNAIAAAEMTFGALEKAKAADAEFTPA
jgi:hypothetical protein